MQRISYWFLFISAGLLLTFLFGCNSDPQPRHYTEIAFREKSQIAASVEAPIHITWVKPEGWEEQSGGDPMRVASFLAPDPALAHTGEMDPKALDVSVVQLAGNAGGIKANVTRWLGQIKLIATAENIDDLISHAEQITIKTGQNGIILDFTGMLSGDLTQSSSMIGTILSDSSYTVFVKAMGDRNHLLTLKPEIRDFTKSMSIEEAKP